jgi:hypothetical protein
MSFPNARIGFLSLRSATFLLLTAWACLASMSVSAITVSRLKEALDGSARIDARNASQEDLAQSTFAMGYISAISDSLAGGSIDGFHACISPQINIEQLMAVVRKHVIENPGEWHYSAEGVVASALADVFPCERQGPRK